MLVPSKISALLLAFSALAAAAPASELEARQSSCKEYHMIVARASTELPGEGIIGTVATTVRTRLGSRVSSEAIDYPALLSPYDTSSAEGTQKTLQALNSIHQRCPNAKLILMGYSQGAHIIGDALCGGGGVTGIGPENAPVSSSVSNKVVAVVQMGDPRHTKNESYHKGTARNKGLFPRKSSQSCEKFASKWRSYCDSGDTFCDSGLNTIVHLLYATTYASDANSFLRSKTP